MNGSPSSVLTLGLGLWGSVNLMTTLGLGIGAAAVQYSGRLEYKLPNNRGEYKAPANRGEYEVDRQ